MSDAGTLSALIVAAVSLIGGVLAGTVFRRTRPSLIECLSVSGINLCIVAGMLWISPKLALSGNWYRGDELSAVCLLLALVLPTYTVVLLGPGPEVRLATLLCGGLLLMSLARSPWMLAISPLLIAWGPALFAATDEEIDARSLWKARSLEITGCGLSLVGLGLICLGPNDSANGAFGEMGLALLLCGLGGLLGWFPVPRVSPTADRIDAPAALVVRRLVPCLLAAVFLLRLTETWVPTRSQTALLGIVALYSLAVVAVRCYGNPYLSQRLSLGVLSSLGTLILAICLVAWTRRHPELNWSGPSNLPDASRIFLMLFAAETAALLLIAATLHLLGWDPQAGDLAETLHGALKIRPWAASVLLAGELSLAGIAPTPGFWGRWTLFGLCVLPHHRSHLTRLAEPDWSFLALGIGLLFAWVLMLTVRLEFLNELAFAEPFRMRRETSSRGAAIAVGLAAVGFALLVLMPVSVVPATRANHTASSQLPKERQETKFGPTDETSPFDR